MGQAGPPTSYDEIPEFPYCINTIANAQASLPEATRQDSFFTVTYAFDGNEECPTIDDGPTMNNGRTVDFSSFFREGVVCSAGESAFRNKGWPGAGERQAGYYIGFSMIPWIDASVDLSGKDISFVLHRSETGPTSAAIAYRIWENDSLHVLQEFALENADEKYFAVALPDTEIWIDTEFRWYAWNASSPEGYLQIDDVRLEYARGSVGVEEHMSIPTGISLAPSYPNPFNPSTTVTLVNDRAQRVTLAAYDLLGRRVAVLHEEILGPDQYEFRFDATGLPGGVYWIVARGDGGRDATAVLLAK